MLLKMERNGEKIRGMFSLFENSAPSTNLSSPVCFLFLFFVLSVAGGVGTADAGSPRLGTACQAQLRGLPSAPVGDQPVVPQHQG